MNIVGIWVDILNDNEEIYDLVSRLSKEICVVIFYNSLIKIKPLNTSIQHGLHTWGFRHPIIALDQEAARYLAVNPYPRKKYCYGFDNKKITRLKDLENDTIFEIIR